MQQYAYIYLLQSHSTCFVCHSTHHQEYINITLYYCHYTRRCIGRWQNLKELPERRYLSRKFELI